MTLRDELIRTALEWQRIYGNAPSITGALGEYDAAMLVGCSEEAYRKQMALRSVVAPGHDFEHDGKRYQVRANRPSGRPGSPVTLVNKPKKLDWDFFVWVHYYEDFTLREAWLWPTSDFVAAFSHKNRLSPEDMRRGKRLFEAPGPTSSFVKIAEERPVLRRVLMPLPKFLGLKRYPGLCTHPDAVDQYWVHSRGGKRFITSGQPPDGFRWFGLYLGGNNEYIFLMWSVGGRRFWFYCCYAQVLSEDGNLWGPTLDTLDEALRRWDRENGDVVFSSPWGWLDTQSLKFDQDDLFPGTAEVWDS
ncbi:MAG TPA: hypothetical protein PLU30_17375 [Verrucomicrobiae bacterium]|nr:hypothetical protein [Verrucomicrobiae bacterium]